jgi:hypothetical protein
MKFEEVIRPILKDQKNPENYEKVELDRYQNLFLENL